MQNTEHFRIVFLNSHLLYYPGSEDSSGADDSSASSTVRKEDSLDIEEEKPKPKIGEVKFYLKNCVANRSVNLTLTFWWKQDAIEMAHGIIGNL